MKKNLSLFFLFILSLPLAFSQAFSENFESYKVGDYLGDVSPVWTTWSGSTGGSEDIQVVDNMSYSGTQSIYYDSPYGGGPQDIVLPFGGVRNTGKFRFKSMWYIPSGNAAYFNFQGGASVGSSWAMDFYMDNSGYYYVNKLSGSYPQDQWFEIKVEIDFASNTWEIFIDGVSQGTFSSGINAVSYLDIYGVYNNSSFWVDDVSYCLNSSCNPDLELSNFSINPNPICSNHSGDVTFDVYNYGPDNAKGFTLGLDMDGQARISYPINLNDLAPGLDTTITISGLFKTNIVGTGLTVRAINVTHDLNILNDTAFVNIKVNPSPNGASLASSSPFQGRLGIGDQAQPDLIEVGKTNKYELQPPSGYSNSNHGTSWFLNNVTARTSYGVIVPSSAYAVSYPSSSNGTLSFAGLNSYVDSTITFSLTISTTPNGCDSVVKRTIRVVPTPKSNFTYPSSVCLGDFTEFTNKSTIHSGFITSKWYFGDGDSSDNTNPIHDYKAAGSYNVKLIVTSSPYGISKDTTIVVNVSEIPTIKFKAVNKCEGVAVDFINQTTIGSGALTYDWDFGDGTAHSTSTNPSHLYAVQGAYRVKLVATANGCASSLVRNAYTFARPVANFVTPSTPVCAGSDVNLLNTTKIAYGLTGTLWTLGDGNISTQTNTAHAYAVEGTYNVKLLSESEFGCKDSITKSVVIKPSPVVDFKTDKLCNGDPTVFTNLSTEYSGIGTVYTWVFSDGTTYSTKNVTKNWDLLGTKTISLKSELSNGCSNEISRQVIVQNQPQADFSFSDICSGETVEFVNKSSVSQGDVSYTWDFGDVSPTSNAHNPEHTYSVPTSTTFTVSLITKVSGGCDDTARKILTVTEIPKCNFTFSGVYLPGNRGYKFTPANTGYAKYEWYFGEGGSSSQTSPVYQYLYSGPFKVTLIAYNSAGCSCQSTQAIYVIPSGLDKISSGNIQMYPNPADKQLTLEIGEVLSGARYVIYNAIGQEVSANVITANNTVISTDMMNNGVYFIKVINAGGENSYKFVVAH